VFGVAARWRTGAASTVRLVTAALAWGYGVRGYGPHRTRHVLAHDPTGARLEGILHQLQAREITPNTLVDAYDRFHRTDHLNGLGPAFFTKILDFAGYRRNHGGIQPLILDSVVAGRLPDQAGPANQHTTGWTSTTWHRYLHWAANQARRPEYRNEPDLVELSLFTGAWRPE
jgi:8-oxoguanine DNA glycosylase-like protein